MQFAEWKSGNAHTYETQTPIQNVSDQTEINRVFKYNHLTHDTQTRNVQAQATFT